MTALKRFPTAEPMMLARSPASDCKAVSENARPTSIRRRVIGRTMKRTFSKMG
jgi:hypothetical protein